jgi:hypothetical protein
VIREECTNCDRSHAPGQRYCLVCKAEYMREWRKSHPISPEQRKRRQARSTASIATRRGKLKAPPLCELCGAVPPQERHHEDYDRPLDVRWFCRKCHVRLTKEREAERKRADVSRETLPNNLCSSTGKTRHERLRQQPSSHRSWNCKAAPHHSFGGGSDRSPGPSLSARRRRGQELLGLRLAEASLRVPGQLPGG